MDLIINPKFKEILPVLSEEEYKHLESSLLKEGCRDPVLIWHNQIVDGHNRDEICKKNGLQYRTNEMPFADENEALKWILLNQLGRRNLTRNQRTLYIGQLYELEKLPHGGDRKSQEWVKAHQNAVSALCSETNGAVGELTVEIEPEFQPKPQKTAVKVAQQQGVSPRAVHTAVEVTRALDTLPAETKADFLAGKVTQKAVIEQAKEVAAPKPAPTPNEAKDDFTRTAKKHGTIFRKIFAEYETAATNAGRDFKSFGQKFRDHAERLNGFQQGSPETLRLLDTEASMLKILNICPKCDGKKCDRCGQKGYVIGEDRNDILREIGIKK